MSIKRRRLDFHEIAKGEIVTRHVETEPNGLYLITEIYKRGETFNVCDINALLPFKDRKKQRANIEFKREPWYYFTIPNRKELKEAKDRLNKKIKKDPGTQLGHGIQIVIKKINEALEDLGYNLANKKFPADYH